MVRRHNCMKGPFLCQAAREGDVMSARKLILQKYDVNAQDAVRHAAHRPGAALIDPPRCQYGCTALHWACMVGSEPVARLLTESGAVINSVNKAGCASWGRSAVVSSHGPPVPDRSPAPQRGWTPLHFALRDGHVSIVRLLTTSKAGRSKMKVLTDVRASRLRREAAFVHILRAGRTLLAALAVLALRCIAGHMGAATSRSPRPCAWRLRVA